MFKHIFLSVFALAFHISAIAQSNLVGKPAPGFTLEDQFDKKTTVKFPEKSPVILVFSDRDKDAAKQADKWASELVSEYGKGIKVVAVAVTGKGAKMVKNKVKNGFQKSDPILFDWENEVAPKYNYDDKDCLIVYINKKGTVEAIASGPYSDTKYNTFTDKLDDEIDE